MLNKMVFEQLKKRVCLFIYVIWTLFEHCLNFEVFVYILDLLCLFVFWHQISFFILEKKNKQTKKETYFT